MSDAKPLLYAELVPSTAWGINVRSKFTRPEWDALREKVYVRANHRCEICGGAGGRHPVEAHEVWSYDIATRVQKLERLIALCPTCHQVKHLGRTIKVVDNGRALVVNKLKKVNGWTGAQASDHITAVLKEWEERSLVEWTMDLSIFEEGKF